YSAALVAIATFIPVVPYSVAAKTAFSAEVVATPMGDMKVVGGADWVRDLVHKVAAAPSKDAFFFYGTPMLIFLTGREQASRYDMFLPEYTLPSQYREACLTAMRGAAWFVVDRRWADPNFLKSMFPAMQNPPPPETRKFEDAMQKGFEL